MKHFTRLFIYLMTIILLSACVNIPIGDGNKLKVNKKGITLTDDEGEEHQIEVDEEGMSITDGKTGERKLETSEEGVTFQDGEGKEHVITVDGSDEHLLIESESENGGSQSFQLGDNLALAEELPKDIPVMDDANMYMANSINGEVMIGYQTEKKIEDIVATYDAFFAQDTFQGEPMIGEQKYEDVYIKTYEAIRDEDSITVHLMQKVKLIQITIYYEKR